MGKVIAFLNKYAVLFNSLFILFWLWILYGAFQELQTQSFGIAQIAKLILPLLLLTLSFYNLSKAIKKKKS